MDETSLLVRCAGIGSTAGIPLLASLITHLAFREPWSFALVIYSLIGGVGVIALLMLVVAADLVFDALVTDDEDEGGATEE